MVNVTTTARVKALLGDTSSTNDALYATLIDSVSREFEDYLGYPLLQAERTELYDLGQNDEILFLKVVPVVSVAEVKIGPNYWDFTTLTALTANQDYKLGDDGQLFLNLRISAGFQKASVKYTAGLGANDAAVIAAAPQLALAADIQVSEEFRRRNNPTTASRPGPGGTSKTYTSPHGFLPRVGELLGAKRRVVLV